MQDLPHCAELAFTARQTNRLSKPKAIAATLSI